MRVFKTNRRYFLFRQTIFYFLIKQLGGLKDPKDPAFKRYFYLLENLAYVKSFNMCFDLEECSEIICALYQLIFKIVNDEHSGKVRDLFLSHYFSLFQSLFSLYFSTLWNFFGHFWPHSN